MSRITGMEPILSGPKVKAVTCMVPSYAVPWVSAPFRLQTSDWVMSVCAKGLASCSALPSSSSMRHLCCFTDNSVCPSQARAIKGSFQSYCHKSVNTGGCIVIVRGEMSPLSYLKSCWRVLHSPRAWGLSLVSFLSQHTVQCWSCFIISLFLDFYHQCEEMVGG